MSSMICSQGMVLATAMAVSGTVILLALRLQKSLPPSLLPPLQETPQSNSRHHHHPQEQILRSCISPDGKKKKNKKRVKFAEDVMDPIRDSKEFRRKHAEAAIVVSTNSSASSSPPKFIKKIGSNERRMPENRVALYNGILRDRVVHRFAYSCY
ncbi:uncharacterized protein LOC126677938 [Mercurialis annua]|uniref:uncharacterized protein LOC126677938 n=1 Tax=Mercurialis annua TaxID=3986 RepID=UPI002160F4DF|nr:uncharacterized protein LOC126677938 [Mercurialis annua]